MQKDMIWHAMECVQSPGSGLQHVAGDIDNIQSASVVMYEREFFYADVVYGTERCSDYRRLLQAEKVNMRALVLWTSMIFCFEVVCLGGVGKRFNACPTVMKKLPLFVCVKQNSLCGHRRFLKKPHKWRRSLEFNGQTDNTDPPKEFGRDVILAQLDRLPTRVKGKHPSHGGVEDKTHWFLSNLTDLTAILNTLLMNDKSKDTAKARQDLQNVGAFESGLWPPFVLMLFSGQTKNGKCLKPQAAYSFTPENRKKFCQYIKGVKLPDGFGSCFKHKVTDNDTNITGLKSHDCHIMMQRLLPYGLQNYLPDKIAKPIIDLCSLFKQICSATLMEDDMLKAQIKVVDILCELELIYPPVSLTLWFTWFIIYYRGSLKAGPIRPRLNDLDNATLHIDGQSTVVDAPPDIIDVPDEDDDIIGDEDALPHDLQILMLKNSSVDDDGVGKFILVKKMIDLELVKVTKARFVAAGIGAGLITRIQRPETFRSKERFADPTTGVTGFGGDQAKPSRGDLQRLRGIKYISFGMIPRKYLARALKSAKPATRAWSHLDRDRGRWLAFRDEMRAGLRHSRTYPSSLTTFLAYNHTVDGQPELNIYYRVFLHYIGGDEGLRLRVEYRRIEINAVGKRWDFYDEVLSETDSMYSDMFKEFESGGAAGTSSGGGCGDDEVGGDMRRR
ncbi:zinc finger, PHD-type containing protein [Tanacetum coccineum]